MAKEVEQEPGGQEKGWEIKEGSSSRYRAAVRYWGTVGATSLSLFRVFGLRLGAPNPAHAIDQMALGNTEKQKGQR